MRSGRTCEEIVDLRVGLEQDHGVHVRIRELSLQRQLHTAQALETKGRSSIHGHRGGKSWQEASLYKVIEYCFYDCSVYQSFTT